MKTISDSLKSIKTKLKPAQIAAFVTVIVVGLLVHMVVMVSDWPNHDGLSSLYFDQNMITSGRWFLTIACGISTYFSLPWVIGVLSLIYIGITSILMVDILEVESPVSAGIIGGFMASFPALASTFAYVFTMDGYMLGLLMAVASVYFTKKYKFGFIPGAVLLAFSLGTYQAYLPFAVLLCLYCVVLRAASSKDDTFIRKLLDCLHYLYMGVAGAGLYYVILQILLKLQGKVLDTYQGIDSLDSGVASGGLANTIITMYKDFISFTLKSNILTTNVFSVIAMVVLCGVAVFILFKNIISKKWYKSIWLYVILIGMAAVLPIATNIVLLVSPGVNYHLIMRYQWVLFPICMVAFIDRFAEVSAEANKSQPSKQAKIIAWLTFATSIVIILCYGLAVNVGYSNLQKKYERTYAYCVRLLDRIEQTEGYYEGIPVALIGVVSDTQYPSVDLTGGVTDNMIGLSGDYLLYKGSDYQLFIKAYLGATLNVIDQEKIGEIYYMDEYQAMDSFPGKDSVKVIDGILCIKTENLEEK